MKSEQAMICAIVGGIFLLAGIRVSLRKSEVLPPLDRWCAFGVPLVAAALAAFGMQHLLAARLLVEVVPVWMPARLFWVYFVGAALLAAALSFALQKALWISAPFLALLFVILALSIDLPSAIAEPYQWIGWSMVLRELSYAAGAVAIFSSACERVRDSHAGYIFTVARWTIIAAVFYFCLEQTLSPQYSPGVPDLLMTPAWVPAPRLLTHLSGIVFLISGVLLITNRYLTLAVVLGGAWMVFLTLTVYVPTVFIEFGGARSIEGVDFVYDTILFGGTMLLLGFASPRYKRNPGIL